MATNDSSDAAESGIAIVGMGLRVPGARTPGEYWKNIAAGVESVRQLTDEELLANGESAERLKHPRYVKSAAILQDMDTFDPEFFGLSPKEGGIMDPQHRQLLETAWEALEDAGHTPEKFEGPIGVWAGCGMGAYFANNILTNRELLDQVGLFLLRHTGNDKDFLPTRISYCMNLRGPSVGVQTACSTSLVAVHYACQALLNRECDMALAGGVTIEIPHARGYIYEEGEILSPDGHCRAFDHRSAGTIFGSGAGMVVLRRVEDAIADGDQIYAVIKGSAVNNDGSGKVGYLAPSVEGQAAAVAEALAVADISAATIGYVEAHGTGTAVGDPIEIAALTEAFRETTDRKGYCGIGSVKTNIGHLDTAAGVASLIKATLALKNRKLPPSLNFEKPNPHIDFSSTPFFVNAKLRDFPAPTPGGRRRATVNSLGVGGTNAHVVLEEAPPRPAPAQVTHAPELLIMSARSRASLDGVSKKLAGYLRETPNASLHDVAYTLATGRAPFSERRVLVARDREHAVAQLDALDPRKVFTHAAVANASVVFMFPGGGAQYPNMGRRLYETEPVFKEHVDRGLGLLAKRVAFNPRALLFPEPAEHAKAAAELERPSYQLPLIFIIEFALAKLWQSLGITPAALIGHSVGENTAAAIAGVFTFEDALDLILLRGRLMDEVPEGAMMSVPLSANELRPLLGTELDLACVNAPELCVASGPRPQILALQKQLAERDVECQLIRINIAAHSRMLDGALERFGAFLRKIRLSAPSLPVISNRTGKRLLPEEARSPEYWVEHLRNTVLFGEGIGTLLEQPGRVFLEVGPGRALSSLARMHPAVAQGQAFIGSLPHVDDDTPDHEIFLAAFGRLWAAGVEVDLAKARKTDGQRVSLPTYAFQKQRYWIEQKAPTAPQESAPYPKRLETDRWYFAPTWRAHYPDVDPDNSPHTWLIFVDETGLGQSVAERLRAAGDEVVTVRSGDTFTKVSDHEYRLAPEHGTEGYESLIREVMQSGKPPDRIAHFWLLSEGETFRPGSSFFHRNQELGFYSLLFLAQALSAAELPVKLHISVITRGMQKVGSSRLRYPDQATVLGPIKVMPRELEGVTCTSIDLEAIEHPEPAKLSGTILKRLLDARKNGAPKNGASTSQVARVAGAADAEELEQLLSELRMPPSNGEISLANDSRWVRRYEAIPAPRAEKPKLRQGGVYMVTGGLGGIGLTIAKSLAESEQAKLVLINRTPLPPREEWDDWLQRRPAESESSRIRTVRQLEALGAEVLVAAGDVADLDRMNEVLEETKARFGALHGVIHAAGVLEDAPLGAKRQASVEAVFGPKVYGTLVLDRVLANEPLDFFVVFSSTSTAIAAAGQVDYVAANAFLDAFADKARAEGRNVLSLAWGVWSEVGLAASAADKLGGDGTQGRGAACSYPLFTGKWLNQGNAILRGTLDPGALWILDEHRTENRQAVMPGTGYLELARAALREIGHDGPFAIEDLYFLRPLDVPDAGGLEFRVRLKSSDDGFNFELQSKRRLSDGREGYVLHAQAFLRRFLPVAPAPLDLAQLDQRCQVERFAPLAEGHRVKQEAHLLFGPRWRNLRHYAIGEGEAFAELNLREAFVPDLGVFGLHPGMLDIATGFAIELEPSYNSERLWVPVSYDRISVYGDLTPKLYSHVVLRPRTGGTSAGGFARFDITLTDDKGNVLVDIDGFAMQAIAGTSFEIVEPRAQELEQEGPRRELAAAERAFLHNLTEGITPKEGVEAFRRLVDALPRARVIVSSMDVRQLVKQADLIVPQATEGGGAVTFERPALSSEYVAPRSEVEKTLAAMWENLLGVAQVGVRDNFFELGGHSLVAVRLFARMKKTFGVDYPISVLIERPTIEGCAALVAPSESTTASVSVESPRAEKETRYKHLVPMNPPSGDKRGRLPFFLVAGMFGNVMNLRHLAGLVGEERPFHGVQARGLLGNENPHETFEESARDYLAEIRAVQPKGPYLLGGFSGGGITAYEMARQLVAEGEEVPLIVMLDTPIPHDEPLTLREKLQIHQQNFQRDGAQYVVRWAEHKLAYKKELEARAAQAADQEKGQDAGFRSQVIEAAFYRAIERYTLLPSNFHIALFRPRLKAAFKFGPGRAINVDRRRIYYDNGWAPYASKVDVFETPGDHDSMVLEPNVRILAARLRECLDQAEARTAVKQAKTAPADKASPQIEASL